MWKGKNYSRDWIHTRATGKYHADFLAFLSLVQTVIRLPWHELSRLQHTELFNRKIQNLCSGLWMCVCLREKARVRCNYSNMFFQRAPRNGRRHTESKQTIHTAYLCMLLSWCAGQCLCYCIQSITCICSVSISGARYWHLGQHKSGSSSVPTGP